MIFHLESVTQTYLADTDTPVSLYLQLRDRFPETLLLEHSESVAAPGLSYICCDPLAGLVLEEGLLTFTYPDGSVEVRKIEQGENLVPVIDAYRQCFTTDIEEGAFLLNGLFGYFSYDAVGCFEQISVGNKRRDAAQIPDIRLAVYRYMIVYDHVRHSITAVQLYRSGEEQPDLSVIGKVIGRRSLPAYPFRITSEERALPDAGTFLAMAESSRQHCLRGDVFQVVMSQAFERSFFGDEFHVYRALRSINPSQYLFFFDYTSYRLFGSSPEAQLKIKAGRATIHPIAGTYPRSGEEGEDQRRAEALLTDAKEVAEHVMLVDLARNDLSKTFRRIAIPVFKMVHKYSHVMHMVSEVTGENPTGKLSPLQVLADTFPAGTLSGAPKYRAMELIEDYEPLSRGFYGGCAGFISFGSDCNLAIMIRSFMSRDNTLHYRAGAGIVASSVPESELQEVNNKVAALRKAIDTANTY